MPPKGYCTAEQVAAVLGVASPSPEFLAATSARIAAAEDAIDRYTGRAWLVPSPATAETHRVGRDARVWLDRTPMLAVTAARTRYPEVGAATTTLVAATDYELADPAHGVLLLRSGLTGSVLVVDYTHADPLPVPPVVAQVCLEMSARSMMAAAAGSGSGTAQAVAAGVKRYQVGQELMVEFADAGGTASSGSSSGGVTVPTDLLGQLDAARLVRPVLA